MDNLKIRVLIADDHTLVRTGIINLMENEKEIFVVGEAETGEDLVRKYFELKPDVVLADIAMPGISGIEALKKIVEKDNLAKVLFLSMYEGDDYIYSCVKAGGMGLISKNVVKGELLYAIQTVNEGKRYFGINMTEDKVNEIIDRYEKRSVKPDAVLIPTAEGVLLTHREIQILKFISEGLTSNEIAEKLNIGKRTIDSHRTHLIQKLNLKSLPDLIKYAIKYYMENPG